MPNILPARGLAAVLVLTAACAPEPEPAPAPEATSVASAGPGFRARPSTAGRLRFAGGRLTFEPCSGAGGVVGDLPDGAGAALVDELGAGDVVMAMVRIEDGTIAEIRYAGPEGPDCSRLPPGGDVEARGNEPFWTVRVTGASATVYTPETMDGVVYRDGTWSRQDEGQWRFEASGEGGATLALDLIEGVCRDGMSGARFPFTATLVRRGRAERGCALEGRG
jgi:uncharacterized membrane protein